MDPFDMEEAAFVSLEAGSPACGLVYATLCLAAEVRGLRKDLRRRKEEREVREGL